MTNQFIRRRVSLRLLFLFTFLLVSVILAVSGSVKSFAKLNEDSARESAKGSSTRWITVAENEVNHIQKVVRDKGESFDLNIVEKHGELSVIESDERQILDLTRNMHEEFHKCAGFMAHETLEAARLSVEETRQAESNQLVGEYTIDNQNNVNAMLAEAKEAQILETITRLSTDFPNRRYNQPSGLDSANWIKNKWTALAAGRSDITVEFFDHRAVNSPQPSIILTVPGTTLPNEVVVLGGHQDSINRNGPTVNAPGADDDASGIASLTETIRVLVAKNFRPRRTVKFMAYAAEEIGLVGSNAIAADFQARGVNVVGVLQLDMTNYKSADSTVDIAVITDLTNAAQNQFLRELITTYQPSLTFANATCGYGCSDHASWTNKGFPASFPFEPRSNPTIHTTSDTLAQSGNTATHAVKYTNLALSYIGELAKGTLVSTYESDVADRQNNDGLIQPNDVTQVQRFAIGLDQPFQSNEFQRADSAPFATRGDGVIDSADITQAQRYEIGLDARQTAAGPTAPIAGGSFAETANAGQMDEFAVANHQRQLRVESATSSAGQQITVYIRVDAVGDESGYSFYLNYDTSVLTLPPTQATTIGTAGGFRFCNPPVPGELRCLVSHFENDNPMSTSQIGESNAGDNQLLLTVRFNVAAGAQSGTTNLTLSNVVTNNDDASRLVITGQSGTVTITTPTAASVSVSGRVLNAFGRGIGGVRLSVTDVDGNVQAASTSSFGYYRFENLRAGENYVLSISAKRYRFASRTNVLSVSENLSDYNFVALP